MPVDLRTRKLAQLAVREGVRAKPGDKIIISGGVESIPFLVELYKEIILQKAIPVPRVGLPDVSYFYYKHATKEQLNHFPQNYMDLVKECQGTIGVNSDMNTRELANADPKKLMLRQKVLRPISDYVNNGEGKLKRVTIAYPVNAQAQEAEMSLTEYENFVYKACLMDFKKFRKLANKISDKFEKGKEVHLIGEGVDLKFSIKGKNCITDVNDLENIPFGEVFMAPVRNSLNGWIKFDYPAIWGGKEVTDIELKFEKGKVVESKSSKNEDLLKEALAVDENASYVGEFGIGFNPNITKFTKELLFDEKMGGTIHLALGMAYKENGGGNDSTIHWDIVKSMTKAKIILDGKVVQENGEWKI